MKTITFFIFSLALFLSFSLPAQKAQKPVNRGMTPKEVKVDTVGLAHIYSQRYALLIGNSHYKNGWDSLKGVITDIEYVKKTLEGLGFNVIVKMDQNATEMPEAYKSFIADYGSDGQSCLLFYYAGHGCTIKIRGKDMGYILPVDCPKVPKDEKNMKDFLTHAMSMDDFEQYAKLIWSNHALFLFDACFAGSIFENMRGSAAEEAIQRKAAQPVRQFITSGSADESVPDNSYFRELLVEALNGSADANNDHYVTGRELAFFLTERVPAASKNKLHPQSGMMKESNFDKGDFIFALNSTAATSGAAFGSLEVTTQIDGALYLDNTFIRNVTADSSYTLPDISVGNHTMKIAGEETDVRNIYISPNQPRKELIKTTRTGPSPSFPDMSSIPSGTYDMGSTDGDPDERPVHKVILNTFSMGKYEVTVNQFMKFIKETDYQTDAEKNGGAYIWTGSLWEKREGVNWKCDAEGNILTPNNYNQPVTHVSWNDANAYCGWLSKKKGENYRLPTEAEWEYAGGGTKHNRYSWGTDNPSGKKGGNVADESAKTEGVSFIWNDYDDKFALTAPVGNFAPNEFGLYDMTGNVWEWCSDWYSENYYSGSPFYNPKGPATGTCRVARGGSCIDQPANQRITERVYLDPSGKKRCVGFRVVKSE